MTQAMRMSGKLALDHHTRLNPWQVTNYYLFDIIPISLYIRLRDLENITEYIILKNNGKKNLTLLFLYHLWSDAGDTKG